MSVYIYIINLPFELTIREHPTYVTWELDCNGYERRGKAFTHGEAYHMAVNALNRLQHQPPGRGLKLVDAD